MSAVMTAKQAAHEYFGGTVSYWKLLDLAKSGKIPHVRVGGRVIFRRAVLDEWMRGLEVRPAEKLDESSVRPLAKII